MKKVFGMLCILLIGSPCFAESKEGAYLILGTGINFAEKEIDIPSYSVGFLNYLVQTKTNNGLFFLGGGGLRLNNAFRIEGELGYRKNKINEIKIKEMNLIGNSILEVTELYLLSQL